jgi:hypothetical protein
LRDELDIIFLYMATSRHYVAEKDYFGVIGKAFDDGRFLQDVRTAIVNDEDEDLKKLAKKKGYSLGPKDIEWLKKEVGEGKTILEIIYEAKGGHGGHGGSYRT